jgi:hypothetical protein
MGRHEIIIMGVKGTFLVKVKGTVLALDPDDQVRSVVRLIFEKLQDLGTAHAVTR